MTRDEFYAMPKISACLPLTFETGNQKWTNFVVQCGDCEANVGDEDTRGFAVPIFASSSAYRGSSTLTGYHVTAQALCQQCEKLTTADYVLREDMTLTGRDPHGDEEKTWGMRRLTFWERIVDKFRAVLGR